MPGENETNVTVEGGEATHTSAPATEPKSQRAPRQKRVKAEAASETSAKASRPARQPRQKRDEAATSTGATAVAATAAPNAAKSPRKARAVKSAAPKMEASSREVDEFADLIQLEEENKRLRKALSEKLRSENADLRKKLGLDQ